MLRTNSWVCTGQLEWSKVSQPSWIKWSVVSMYWSLFVLAAWSGRSRARNHESDEDIVAMWPARGPDGHQNKGFRSVCYQFAGKINTLLVINVFDCCIWIEFLSQNTLCVFFCTRVHLFVCVNVCMWFLCMLENATCVCAETFDFLMCACSLIWMQYMHVYSCVRMHAYVVQ